MELARAQGEDFQLVLTRYVIERPLSWLSQSDHRGPASGASLTLGAGHTEVSTECPLNPHSGIPASRERSPPHLPAGRTSGSSSPRYSSLVVA
jgi:hypothetical protein